MNVTTSSPSRLLKITAATARYLLGLLMGAWLLLALSVLVLHVWIVPRIGDYRAALEKQATRAIGVPVRIGSISARSDSLFPTIELRDVVLLDERQQEGLRLEHVVASVSPRSLWKLSFEQLVIERPVVEMRRDKQGSLFVAGLDMSRDTSGAGDEVADWFFAQREVVVQGGTVRWTDEQRQTEPLFLTDVEFVARNGTRRHAMRLDATPPVGWGERLTLRGQLRQPLLSVRSGNWRSWDGQLYADLPYADMRRLGDYVDLKAMVREGSGAVRIWADINDGAIVGGVADLALTRVDASLSEELKPLLLRNLTGRLSGRHANGTVEFATSGLQFETVDRMRWPGGNLWFQHTEAKGRTAERTALRADQLDLAALALIADRLPLGDSVRTRLKVLQPRGRVERIEARWQGEASEAQSYQVNGRLSAFSLAAQPAPPSGTPAAPTAGTPGVSGATVDFEATQTGGRASLSIAKGALDLPGVFEDPVLPIDRLSAQLQWKLNRGATQVQVSNLRFANVDAEGEAQALWQSSDPARSGSAARYPGVLDLKGKLTRAEGPRVWRYLPLHIPKQTRDYVRQAITQGRASSVDFKLRGDLWDMPFTDPKQGEFRIAAKVAAIRYAYVPPSPEATLTWPALTDLSGELIFERAGMQVRNARGRIEGAQGIEVTKAEAQIADLSHHAPVLKLAAQAKGPLGELLRVGGPLAGEAATALADVRASGPADYKLGLELPLEAMDKAKVQARVVLANNELQLDPGVPRLTQANGNLNFTESGFSLAGVQARGLGGAMRIEGGGRFTGKQELDIRVQGTASAEGLRATHEIDWLARLAKNASGSTSYAAQFALRQGEPELLLTSSLQGLGLQLPAPLTKAAEEVMPLRVEKKTVLREVRTPNVAPTVHDQISLEIGKLASARYVRDISGVQAHVLRGAIGIGLTAGETAQPPERGVLANLRFGRLDVDAWQSLLNATAGQAPETAAPVERGDEAQAYLPTVIALRAQALAFSGRTLHDVVLGGTRDGALWRANIDAVELSGYAQYHHAKAGRLYARLARMKIAPSEATAVASLLDEPARSLPALDIVIDDFELFGRALGRAEINAVNRGGVGGEWMLHKLTLSNSDASFKAQGSWALPPGVSTGRQRRRTRMDFKLDIADAGALLNRLGMKDVLRRGHGRLEGEVDWSGSPLSIDYPSLSGQLTIDVETGQFLKADPGIAKLLGVMSLQALPRRLTLDFRDIFSAGFAFDFLRGDASIVNGVLATNNLQMKGVNAAVLMDGSADLARETQNIRVVVVPEISAGTAALVATAINPAIGLGAFLAQMVLSRPLIAAATQEFQVEGTWSDPKVNRVPRRSPNEAKGSAADPSPAPLPPSTGS